MRNCNRFNISGESGGENGEGGEMAMGSGSGGSKKEMSVPLALSIQSLDLYEIDRNMDC